MSTTLSFRATSNIQSLLEAFSKKVNLTKTAIINAALLEYLSKTDSKIAKQIAILRKTDNYDDYISEDL